MRKGQMIGQVFIFILAGLVFVLILGYGYRAITNFMERGQEVQLLDFRNELDSTVNMIKRDYGSVQRIELRMPVKTELVCFVVSVDDIPSAQLPNNWESNFKTAYPLLYTAWSTGSENVFLLPRQPTPILIKDISIENGYCCIPAAGGRVSLRMEGKGNKAKITPWSGTCQ